jgi:hypothetical protein
MRSSSTRRIAARVGAKNCARRSDVGGRARRVLSAIERVIQDAGLSRIKARQIKALPN